MTALLLCCALGQAAEDPHPDRTAFLGPLARLLDDRRVFDWLDAPAAARERWAKTAAERDAARERLENLDPAHRQEELVQHAAQRQRAFVWQLAGDLGESRMRRLVGLAIRQWGEDAAFAVGAAERLGIAAAQQTAQRCWLERAPMAEPPARIVTAAQRRQAEEWLATPPAFVLELRVEAEARRVAAALLPADLPLRLDPCRPLHLLALEDTLAAVRLPPAERAPLRAWALQGLRDEAKAVAPRSAEDSLPARQTRASECAARAAAELPARLGPERTVRFAELRRQLAGWGGAFGEDHRGELGISPDAVASAFAAASKAVDRLHDSPAGFQPAAARAACDQALQSCLTPAQRQQWRARCGAAFPEETLRRLRRVAERP